MTTTKNPGAISPATSVKSDDVKTIKSRKTGEEVPYVPEEKLLKTAFAIQKRVNETGEVSVYVRRWLMALAKVQDLKTYVWYAAEHLLKNNGNVNQALRDFNEATDKAIAALNVFLGEQIQLSMLGAGDEVETIKSRKAEEEVPYVSEENLLEAVFAVQRRVNKVVGVSVYVRRWLMALAKVQDLKTYVLFGVGDLERSGIDYDRALFEFNKAADKAITALNVFLGEQIRLSMLGSSDDDLYSTGRI